jgi:O-antigen/teichoic acid export membrane protein
VIVTGATIFITVGIPMAIAVSITRHRLYEIDRIVSRTVSYTLLTVVLAAVYIGAVVGFQNLVPASDDLSVAASTLAAAALFDPLRLRMQSWMDRRFNLRRYSAEQLAKGAAARPPDTLLAIVLAGVNIGGVMGLPLLIPASGNLAVAAATLAAAALFNPLRRKVQHRVDRRFNRRNCYAGKVVDSFGVRRRYAADLATITSGLYSVVAQSAEPASAAVWVGGERTL